MKNKLTFIQRSDRRASIILLGMAIAAVGGFIFFGSHYTRTALDTADTLIVDSLHRYIPRRRTPPAGYYKTADGRRAELFAFDPNTADSTDLLRLGLQPWQVRSVYHYRAKGGIYRKPADFARLYGLTQKQYRELEPYIHISSDYSPVSELALARGYDPYHESKPYKEYDRDTLRYPLKLKAGQTIDLSIADTTQLKKVPGIGSGYARAIMSYGKRLGGYVRVEQLREIDGFPVEALAYFRMGSVHTQKLNVNKLSVQQLRRHPYINFYQARAIEEFRRLRGPIKDIGELRLSPDFPPEAIERLRPYVAY